MEEYQKEIWAAELKKCQDSPYYLFTNYIRIGNEKATTFLTEQEFNDLFKHYINGK